MNKMNPHHMQCVLIAASCLAVSALISMPARAGGVGSRAPHSVSTEVQKLRHEVLALSERIAMLEKQKLAEPFASDNQAVTSDHLMQRGLERDLYRIQR